MTVDIEILCNMTTAEDVVTGAYQFRFLDFASALAITPGTPVSGDLTPANESDLYQFSVVAGEKYFFDTQARSGAGNARWRLIDPFNNVVFEGGFNSINSDVDTLTLTRPGTYTLLIEGRYFETDSGIYTFNVIPQGSDQILPPSSGTPLVFGSPISGSISVSGEQDLYTFTVGANRRIHFDSQTNNGNIVWTLAGPAGTVVSDRAFTGSIHLILVIRRLAS